MNILRDIRYIYASDDGDDDDRDGSIEVQQTKDLIDIFLWCLMFALAFPASFPKSSLRGEYMHHQRTRDSKNHMWIVHIWKIAHVNYTLNIPSNDPTHKIQYMVKGV